ncbi:hypothetical protein TNCV_1883911 [Trichonephila clavipes]|nr:hypothetical protein TNCV_1883911 [Trichonephila clavipes]
METGRRCRGLDTVNPRRREFFLELEVKAFPDQNHYSLWLSPFLWLHRFLPVPSRSPPGHEFPHFSNVPSVTAGGLLKARQRGNTHNVLPGTVQGQSQGGFLDMKESPPPSHPQLRSSTSGTALGRAILRAVFDEARILPLHTLPRKGPFRCPISSPRGKG